MNNINLGATIARERRAAGVTQGELAAHLGVTKAAVSKWELGQSLPDVAQLPRIASYFSLTLDELFDYRPQLTEDEVRETYIALCDLFVEDPGAAYARMDDLVRDYGSCWNLLLQVAALCMQRALSEPDRVDELMGRARELAERVEARADDVELVRSARVTRAMAECQRGELDDAIALLESVKPMRPLGVEAALAGMYQMKGEREACLKLCQESLFWGEMSVMQSIAMQLPLYVDEPAHLAVLLRAAEGVLEGFALESRQPMEAATFYGGAATACLRAGDEAGAVTYLERLAELLERHDGESLLFPRPSALYDLVPDSATTDPDLKRVAGGLFGAFNMKSQCKLAVTGDAAWAACADDPRFKSLLDRLAAV